VRRGLQVPQFGQLIRGFLTMMRIALTMLINAKATKCKSAGARNDNEREVDNKNEHLKVL